MKVGDVSTEMAEVVEGVGMTVKKKNTRSWILIDSNVNETIMDIDKYAIMHRVQIHARDLRILDPLLSYPSTILGRERAIVLNLEHIKAIVTAEEVLLRDPSDDHVIPVVEELRRRLPVINANQGELGGQNDVETGEEDESPFEFRALEVFLEAICSFHAARTTELETDAYPALDELTSKISSRNLDRVRKLKSAMTRLTARVQKVRDELERLLDDDDDMADLYLSRKLSSASPVSGSGAASWFLGSPTIGSKISRASRASVMTVHGDENDVEELEMLLEAYFMQIDGTLNKLTSLREYIDDNFPTKKQTPNMSLTGASAVINVPTATIATAVTTTTHAFPLMSLPHHLPKLTTTSVNGVSWRTSTCVRTGVAAVDSSGTVEKETESNKKYHFVIANAKFMLDEEEHFQEQLFERVRLFKERNMEQDFWLVIEPKFLDKFPNITKRLKRPAVALVSTNGTWIKFMKLRLDRVLEESFEADSLEEALASNPVNLEFEKPANWVAPYPKYEYGWWESFLPPTSQN